MKVTAACALACAVTGTFAASDAGANWFESFETDSREQWIASNDERYQGSEWDFAGDAARVEAVPKFYGLSRVLDAPVSPSSADGFVIQYEVAFESGVTCSGSYLKLLVQDPEFDPAQLGEQTPYSIMFGPDNCGANHKVHVIFRQRNPVTGIWQEKHMTHKVVPPTDRIPHLYTLELRPDNSFAVRVDGEEKASGSLTADADFAPPFATPREVSDPEDAKPADWVDDAQIPDPEASKPGDWDESAPKTIPDPDAAKPAGWRDDEPQEVADPAASEPEDWSEEDDGVWEAPLVKNPKCAVGCGAWTAPTIANPAYKGTWSAPRIDNPAYKGVWAPRKVPNPGFFEEPNPVATLAPIGAVAIEILANDKGIAFSSVMLGHDIEAARAFAAGPFAERQRALQDKDSESAKASARAERLRAYEEGSFRGMALFAAGEAAERAQTLWEHAPVLVVCIAVGLVAGLSLLVSRCCCGSGNEEYDEVEREARHKKDDDEDGDEDEDDGLDVDKSGLDASAAVPGEEADQSDEDDDDDDDEGAATTRRRVARAT